MTAPDRARGGHQQKKISETIGEPNSAAALFTAQGDAAMPRTCREAKAPERAAMKALVAAPPECKPMWWRLYLGSRSSREALIRDAIRGRRS